MNVLRTDARVLVVTLMATVVSPGVILAGGLSQVSSRPAAALADHPGAFDAVAATEAYLAKVTPEKRTRFDAYFEGGYWLQLWGFLYGAAVALLLSVFFFAMTPVTNTMIRTQEAEADIFGLNAARQPDAEAEVDLMLGEYRKLKPRPIEEIVFFDHPSGYNRIPMAMRWKAENLR